MDPNEALRLIEQHFTENEIIDTDVLDTLEELLEGLGGWLSNGGFPPTITGRPAWDLILAGSLCADMMRSIIHCRLEHHVRFRRDDTSRN